MWYMPREHGESGEFVETVPLDDVLGVFDQVRGPVVLSADVADALDCSRETARRKLEQLHDRGALDRRKVARRVVYWRADQDADESGRERAVTPSEDTDTQRSDPATNTAVSVDVGAFEFERDLTPARREHLVAWLNHAAADPDGVRKSDFENWWTDERAAEAGYNAGSFWEAFAKAAMKQADEFTQPDSWTYRHVDAGDRNRDGDTDPLDESGPYDPADEWE